MCLSVSPKIFGAAQSTQNWSDCAEIWYTCFVGEYLWVFASSFENFPFEALGTTPYLKTRLKLWGKPREPKNDSIWFRTLVPRARVSTWEQFFFISGPWRPFLVSKRGLNFLVPAIQRLLTFLLGFQCHGGSHFFLFSFEQIRREDGLLFT